MKKSVKLAIPFAVAIIVYLIGMLAIDFSKSVSIIDPANPDKTIPQLTAQAWLFLSIFIGVIVGLILEPVPPALVGLAGVALAVFFRVGAAYPASIKPGDAITSTSISNGSAVSWGLSGFADSTVWLIFAAFAIGLGYQKSGLGRRIAMLLVSKLGKSTLGLGYAIALTDGILAPFIPSNTARSGGVVYPIVASIPGMFDSSAEKDRRKIGSYAMWVALASTCVTSSMFLTGLAPNALAVTTATSSGIATITWLGWFIAFVPAGVILFILTPFLAYKLYPPEIKGSPEIVTWAKGELGGLGPIASKEKWMLAISGFALVFWIMSSVAGLSKIWPLYLAGTTTALFVIVFMMAAKIISWDDFLSNKPAWNVLMWFGTLVALASGLKNVGFLDWLGVQIKTGMADAGITPTLATIVLVVAFYVLHYFFASTTAHVTALMALFIVIANAVLPHEKVFVTVVLLMLSLGIMGIITPYGTGPSPVYFGSGYISSPEFWKLGTIFGLVYLVVFLVVDVPWVLFVVPHIITP